MPKQRDGDTDQRQMTVLHLDGERCPKCARSGKYSSLASDNESVWCMNPDCNFIMDVDEWMEQDETI